MYLFQELLGVVVCFLGNLARVFHGVWQNGGKKVVSEMSARRPGRMLVGGGSVMSDARASCSLAAASSRSSSGTSRALGATSLSLSATPKRWLWEKWGEWVWGWGGSGGGGDGAHAGRPCADNARKEVLCPDDAVDHGRGRVADGAGWKRLGLWLGLALVAFEFSLGRRGVGGGRRRDTGEEMRVGHEL